MDGFILVDKPSGISSNGVLDILKKKTKIVKMGHTGTLDPFACGLLVVAVGEAAKFIPYINDEPKVYEAVLKLGSETDTLDCTGKIMRTLPVKLPAADEIKKLAGGLVGEQEQTPPMFSAKKSGGKRLYELARKGIVVERKPEKIFIHELEIVDVNPPAVSFRVSCSGGTYVRVLGFELAQRLGTVGHLVNLKRLAMGEFSLEKACKPEGEWELKNVLLPVESALSHWTPYRLTDMEAGKILKGQSLDCKPVEDGGLVKLKSGGLFLGMGEYRHGRLWPKRLMKTEVHV